MGGQASVEHVRSDSPFNLHAWFKSQIVDSQFFGSDAASRKCTSLTSSKATKHTELVHVKDFCAWKCGNGCVLFEVDFCDNLKLTLDVTCVVSAS